MSATISRVALATGVELLAREFDFADPWKKPDTLVMLHGTAETGEAYRGWIPSLARHFRILCPDLRGVGGSSPIASGDALEMDDLVEDVRALLYHFRVERCLLVGEKLGALVALRFAARHPDQVLALAVASGMIAPRDVIGKWIPDWIRAIKVSGPRAWIDATQAGRMGAQIEPGALDWWSQLMATSSDAGSLVAYLRLLQRFALEEDELRAIRAPTLFLVPARSAAPGAAFEQRRPAEELRAWQRLVPWHEVATIDSASYHIAATHPDECAAAACDFLLRVTREL